jgi:hypothetical protein
MALTPLKRLERGVLYSVLGAMELAAAPRYTTDRHGNVRSDQSQSRPWDVVTT